MVTAPFPIFIYHSKTPAHVLYFLQEQLTSALPYGEVDAMSTYEKLGLALAFAGVVIGILQLLK